MLVTKENRVRKWTKMDLLYSYICRVIFNSFITLKFASNCPCFDQSERMLRKTVVELDRAAIHISVTERATGNFSHEKDPIMRHDIFRLSGESSSWNKYVNRNFSFLSRPRTRLATILTSPARSWCLPLCSSLAFALLSPMSRGKTSNAATAFYLRYQARSPLNNSTCTLLPICKRGWNIDTCTYQCIPNFWRRPETELLLWEALKATRSVSHCSCRTIV